MGDGDGGERGRCPPVTVYDPHTESEQVLRPLGVWLEAVVKKNMAVKMGLFRSPTGKYFLAVLPHDYPLCQRV